MKIMTMCARSTFTLLGAALLTLGLAGPDRAQAQYDERGQVIGALVVDRDAPVFDTEAEARAWRERRQEALNDARRRVVVSVEERHLLLMEGADTLFIAPAAVGSADTLSYGGQAWEFSTPVGERRIIGKRPNAAWIPPLWHYVGFARERGYELHEMAGAPVQLSDGTRLVVRGGQVGRVTPDGDFLEIPQGDHIVFDDTVFVPPHGTVNREIPGELGAFRIDLGDGYLIHGTPHRESIGQAVTHGCIRLRDGDLAHLYSRVRSGTPVIIY